MLKKIGAEFIVVAILMFLVSLAFKERQTLLPFNPGALTAFAIMFFVLGLAMFLLPKKQKP